MNFMKYTEELPSPPTWMNYGFVPPEHLLKKIADGEPYCLSRWGDGEWFSILGASGRNSDKQTYWESLCKELSLVLKSRPSYYLGLRFPEQSYLQREIPRWLLENKLQELQWTDTALVWQDLSRKGRLQEFLDVVNDHDLILVGPPHLQGIKRQRLTYNEFVEVPLVDSWAKVYETQIELEQLLPSYDKPIVLFSAGMTSNVLIHRLQSKFKDCWLLDMGSVFDPYCGHISRQYQKDPSFQEVMQASLRS